MKIPIADQITEAERHRDELWERFQSDTSVKMHNRLHAIEGMILTLRWLAVYETDFRQYMAQRKETT